MFAKVAPIRRFPRSAQPYDYRIPEGLTVNVGSFVEITLRGKPERGIVTELMDSSSIKRLADVVRVYDIDPLTENDLLFYRALARRTYQSLSSVLHAAIPEFLKRATTRTELKLVPIPMSIQSSQVEALKTIVAKTSSQDHQTVAIPSDRFSISVIVSMLRSSDDPILAICPDVNMMREVANAAASVTDSIEIFGGSMNKTQAIDGWNAIRSGSHKLVIASRIGALIPPDAKTRVVVIVCGEDDHSQSDQNPHYDVRWCVQARQETHENKTVLLGTLPRLEDGDLTDDFWARPEVDVVNMKDARRSSDSYHISDKAQELISSADTETRPLFIYFNRKPSDEGKRTTNRDIASELHRLFPAKVIRVVEANDPMPTSGIVIVTNMLLYNVSFIAQSLSGLIIVNAEHPFVYRDFRSLEIAARVTRRLVSWALSGRSPVVVQTINPAVINEALGSTSVFCTKESSMRKRLGYPPFGEIHVLKTKEDLELAESFRATHEGARGERGEVIVKLGAGEVIEEWFTYPPSSDIAVNPDN